VPEGKHRSVTGNLFPNEIISIVQKCVFAKISDKTSLVRKSSELMNLFLFSNSVNFHCTHIACHFFVIIAPLHPLHKTRFDAIPLRGHLQ
jgi:hypothetical protein